MNASGFKDYVTDAIKFWERWRLAYNLVLAAIVIIHSAAGYPASKAVLTLDSALGLFLLAVVANIAYCAAYIADTPDYLGKNRKHWDGLHVKLQNRLLRAQLDAARSKRN